MPKTFQRLGLHPLACGSGGSEAKDVHLGGTSEHRQSCFCPRLLKNMVNEPTAALVSLQADAEEAKKCRALRAPLPRSAAVRGQRRLGSEGRAQGRRATLPQGGPDVCEEGRRVRQGSQVGWPLGLAARRRGQTALHLATARGHGSIVELLLQHGADIEAKKRRPGAPEGRVGGSRESSGRC